MGTKGHLLGMAGRGKRWRSHCLFTPVEPRGVTQDIWVFCTCCSVALPHHLVHWNPESWSQPAQPCAPGLSGAHS